MCIKELSNKVYGLFHYSLYMKSPQCISLIKYNAFTRGIYHSLSHDSYINEYQMRLLGISNIPSQHTGDKIKMILIADTMEFNQSTIISPSYPNSSGSCRQVRNPCFS